MSKPKAKQLVLDLPAQRRFALAGSSASDDGLPVRKYLKDAVTVGQFIHPSAGWHLNVTAPRMQRWARNFALMRTRGIDVPLAKRHEHEVSSENTAGYIQDMFVDGDRLMCAPEVRGQQNIELAETVNRVSVYIEKDYRDTQGNTYDEAITHIALTPQPVVNGQKDFISIAASRGQAGLEIPVFSLAARQGESSMRKELLEKFRGLVKARQEAAEDEVLDAVSKHLDDITLKFSEVTKAIETKTSELKAATEQVQELQKGTTPELDANTLEDRTFDVTARIDRMAQDGVLPPALAASLGTTLCGTNKARNVFMLSRSANANERGVKPLRAMEFLDMIDAIHKQSATLPKPGERTPPQGVALSRDGGAREGSKLTDRLVDMGKTVAPVL